MVRVVGEDRRGAVLVLTMERPHVKNAFNDEMYTSLTSSLLSAESDPSVLVVVLTGSRTSGYFTSGADLTSFTPRDTPSAMNPVGLFMRTLLHFKKPIIAAVNGPAVGIGVTLVKII
jgi:enoyl-CoA hydratase/carnithine racemase